MPSVTIPAIYAIVSYCTFLSSDEGFYSLSNGGPNNIEYLQYTKGAENPAWFTLKPGYSVAVSMGSYTLGRIRRLDGGGEQTLFPLHGMGDISIYTLLYP